MYKPRRIQVTGKFDTEVLRFDFQLWGSVTVLLGDSGTGKSLFCRIMSRDSSRKWYAETYGGKVHLFNDDSRETIDYVVENVIAEAKIQNGLILMDNASNYLTPKLYNIITGDPNNHYIIMTRRILDMTLSPNYFAEVCQGNDMVYRLKYKYAKKEWYM